MNIHEVRTKYLDFMQQKGHVVIPSAPLVPENDPTTLFTGSGMQPLVPYLLGENHPAGTRLTDSQKCFRSMDIEEVGDNRHTTFFEMLGNWSLGDYFKEGQLPQLFAFLTEEIGIDPKRLYVTAFIGDEANGVPRDTEAVAIWQKLFSEKGIDAQAVDIGSEENGAVVGMRGGRIFYYDAKKNWWSRSGTPEKMPAGEPGGPDSEVFYEFTHITHDPKYGEHCHPNCDCGRFLEIGNSVFMEYVKQEDGTFGKLPKSNVDFGGGAERIAAVSENKDDVFVVTHKTLIEALERSTEARYAGETRYAFRIVADHVKAATFLIADGVVPGNVERGYVVRRLLRRAVRYCDVLGVPVGTLASLVDIVVTEYRDAYPELAAGHDHIRATIDGEEVRFRETLTRGIKEFERCAANGSVSGEEAFQLFTTYGFPLELTVEVAGERNIPVDVADFEVRMKAHQDQSRAGSEQKFKGGLADTSVETTRLHTAHHLLLKALQQVLGPSVHQRGSNITAERLRIDFSWGEKMTDEQKKEVERIVNEKIQADLPVVRVELPREEAEKLGAEHEFGAKYPDRVSVYAVVPQGSTEAEPHISDAFSLEFCGGPHVTHTGELGAFKILKEEAVAAGIRRIKAVLQ